MFLAFQTIISPKEQVMTRLTWQLKKLLDSSHLVEPFHILTVTLLSLLLPLSFLLLARLSCANYLLTFAATPYPAPNFLLSLFLHTNPTLLHLLVSVICVATLVHALTGKSHDPAGETVGQARLYGAWVFLCTLQVCVGLGIEGTLAAGIDGADFGGNKERSRSLLSRVVFFLGMHEAMTYWSREVVGPVVDDTVFGVRRGERWAQRVAMAACCGSLWWWRLRDEVEALVLVAEAEREVGVGVGIADFVGWWLYYLTVTIGMVKVMKGVMWVGMILLCRRVRVRGNGNSHDHGQSSNSASNITEPGQPCNCEDKV